MRKIILYGSEHCAPCGQAKAYLNEKNITYAFVDITSGMGHLKRFLKIRDNNEKYNDAKANNYVGIPTLVIDDEPFILNGNESIDKLIEEHNLS